MVRVPVRINMQSITSGHRTRGLVASVALFTMFLLSNSDVQANTANMLIDDFSDLSLQSKLGSTWRGVSDSVMGGVSEANISHEVSGEENCLRLIGDVRLENNGGFIQAALDLTSDNSTLDASEFTGIRLVAKGNGQQYSLHLLTADNTRPWQSNRAHYVARSDVQTFKLPFSEFEPYRIAEPIDITKLRRLGIVAIGRQFQADLKICRLEFYR